MSQDTRPRKRKMEALTGGDNLSARDHKPSSAKAPCISKELQVEDEMTMAAASASGDSGSSKCHQYTMLVRSMEDVGQGPAEVVTQVCELGDIWTHKYPIPLSLYPDYLIRTGNSFYDKVLPELPKYGFKALQVVARGRSGTVILAQDLRTLASSSSQDKQSEHRPVAIKLNTGGRRKQRLAPKVDITEEMIIHRSLSHKNIVSMVGFVNFQSRLGLVLEFCESGNLEQLLRAQDAKFLTEPVARRYFRQIQAGLEYVHHSGIAHRDVCPQNVLVTGNNVLKLADFGHALRFTTGDPLVEDPCGTLGYQAPEVIRRCPYNPRLADIWSLGALLYFMAVGKLPYGTLRTEEKAKGLKPVSFPRDSVLYVSLQLKALLTGMMAYLSDARFSHNRILNSEWLQGLEEKVQIGNFYLVRQPQKTKEGDKEQQLKGVFNI